MMSTQRRIEEKLTEAFAPTVLEVVNESHRHAGHAGSPGTGESHFAVRMTSPAFAGLSRIERQRRVYAVLAEELKGPVHALSLSLDGSEGGG
ncbi:BolA family transcriptional regulator [Marivibrio halodurans]|uniref:BolA family transcriptional regulator n=1 Tax=Marivibrio halodurans TaxID=2039722 RepID=A0A8J7V453_9PROT|nr:BolA family protein [Marivibrio halodurans]MBP5859065.1 BolA family transcriptional regulator [Marivibrio halodurans]